MSDPYLTSHTLLQRAKFDDQNAWEGFIEAYGRFIFHMLNVMRVPQKDIDDLSQLILLKLWKNLGSYDFEKGRFRPWLSTVIKNSVLSYFKSNKKKNSELSMDAHGEDMLLAMPFVESEIEEKIEEQWKSYVAEKALERIAPSFSKNAMDVFRLSLKGMDNAEISAELEIKKTSVAELKARVKSKFVKEIKILIQQYET